MKVVDIKENTFWYDGKNVNNLDMSDGKHIRFKAVDKNYSLEVTQPDKSHVNFKVPDDNKYHKYEIKGKKDQTYTFDIISSSGPGGTVPQMIVRVN